MALNNELQELLSQDGFNVTRVEDLAAEMAKILDDEEFAVVPSIFLTSDSTYVNNVRNTLADLLRGEQSLVNQDVFNDTMEELERVWLISDRAVDMDELGDLRTNIENLIESRQIFNQTTVDLTQTIASVVQGTFDDLNNNFNLIDFQDEVQENLVLYAFEVLTERLGFNLTMLAGGAGSGFGELGFNLDLEKIGNFTFRAFSSQEELDAYIGSEDYGFDDTNSPAVCFAFTLHESGDDKNKYELELQFNDQVERRYRSLPTQRKPSAPQAQRSPMIEEYSFYQWYGFAYL